MSDRSDSVPPSPSAQPHMESAEVAPSPSAQPLLEVDHQNQHPAPHWDGAAIAMSGGSKLPPILEDYSNYDFSLNLWPSVWWSPPSACQTWRAPPGLETVWSELDSARPVWRQHIQDSRVWRLWRLRSSTAAASQYQEPLERVDWYYDRDYAFKNATTGRICWCIIRNDDYEYGMLADATSMITAWAEKKSGITDFKELSVQARGTLLSMACEALARKDIDSERGMSIASLFRRSMTLAQQEKCKAAFDETMQKAGKAHWLFPFDQHQHQSHN